MPFVETSCMDCAPPHMGEGPCCSVKRRGGCTLTSKEELASTAAKNKCTQVVAVCGLYVCSVSNANPLGFGGIVASKSPRDLRFGSLTFLM